MSIQVRSIERGPPTVCVNNKTPSDGIDPGISFRSVLRRVSSSLGPCGDPPPTPPPFALTQSSPSSSLHHESHHIISRHHACVGKTRSLSFALGDSDWHRPDAGALPIQELIWNSCCTLQTSINLLHVHSHAHLLTIPNL